MMNVIGKQMWTVAAAMSLGHIGWAGESPVRQRAASIRTVSAAQTELPPAPMPEPGGAALGHSSSVPPPIPPAPAVRLHPLPEAPVRSAPVVVSPPLISGYQPPVVMHTWGSMPPAGTLGRTYQRRSALISDEEHPRMGVVLVHLPEHADVSARGLKVKWTGDVWRMETEYALLPGIPHIYAVKAEWDTPAGKMTQVRWVRLIMGREVDLEF